MLYEAPGTIYRWLSLFIYFAPIFDLIVWQQNPLFIQVYSGPSQASPKSISYTVLTTVNWYRLEAMGLQIAKDMHALVKSPQTIVVIL